MVRPVCSSLKCRLPAPIASSMVETALAGWGGRIRTHKCRFQNWPLKCGPNSLHFATFGDQRLFSAELPKSNLHPSPVHSAMNMARRSPLRRGQATLERRLLWIREFESSHPSQAVQSLLFDFRLCRCCRHSRVPNVNRPRTRSCRARSSKSRHGASNTRRSLSTGSSSTAPPSTMWIIYLAGLLDASQSRTMPTG